MAILQTCKQQLTAALKVNPQLKDNLSALTKQARGTQRADCIKTFGDGTAGSTALRTFVNRTAVSSNTTKPITVKTHNASISTGSFDIVGML